MNRPLAICDILGSVKPGDAAEMQILSQEVWGGEICLFHKLLNDAGAAGLRSPFE